MKLFIDTETTGLPNYGLTYENPGQPKLVQLACILTEDDGREISSMNVTICPIGYDIPKDVSAIHGITTERATEIGVEKRNAINIFLSLYACADEIVAHNLKFDLFIMRCASWPREIHAKKEYCTMQNYRKLGLLGSARLMEAHKKAFGEEFLGAHSALSDCRAMMRLYFWIKEVEKGNVKLPR
jgi:DNA polymerase-3 subunit epsilon